MAQFFYWEQEENPPTKARILHTYQGERRRRPWGGGGGAERRESGGAAAAAEGRGGSGSGEGREVEACSARRGGRWRGKEALLTIIRESQAMKYGSPNKWNLSNYWAFLSVRPTSFFPWALLYCILHSLLVPKKILKKIFILHYTASYNYFIYME